jgi:multidrug efflux system outer membrane protein
MNMNKRQKINGLGIMIAALVFSACVAPYTGRKTENKTVPAAFTTNSKDSANTARLKWKDFFKDPDLAALIDTALKNNQELNIMQQEIGVAKSDVIARKGSYLPYLYLEGGAGTEKAPRYTRNGAVDDNIEILPGKRIPDPLSDFLLSANVSWEVDIWKKLRNSKKAAVSRYLASVEGRNFMVTHLISEIANSYYELLALDNQLAITKQNIGIQNDALEIVQLEKLSTRVTELAVKRFEAQVLHTKSLQFDIQQQITEAENRLNFLVGRFPQPVKRNTQDFTSLVVDTIQSGFPSQLLQNRPDIKRAELELVASKLDVKAAKANFYPSLAISAGVGYGAFNPSYLIKTPQSLLYSLAGDLLVPLVNRTAIKAAYNSASAKQVQAVYNYEQTILNAYIEVANQLAKISNLRQSYDLKDKQVKALAESVTISNSLFKSARADYMEVLLTQRDALESRFELIETKKQQMNAMVNVYRALGGGWK